MKTYFLKSAIITMLSLMLGLSYTSSAKAGSTIFSLPPEVSAVMSHMSACWQDTPPVNGVPAWDVLYYAGFRTSTRARGLLVRQWIWSDNSSVGGPVGWVEAQSYTHSVWDGNNLAIFQMPYVGDYVAFYVTVSIPKVGQRAYLVHHGWKNSISNTCG
jgi:hypothetical protein